MSSKTATPGAARDWGVMLRVYRRRPVITMLFLGFAAGLPFMLVFGTLSAWLREEGVTRTAIGFFSWIGITYSIKVLWSPIVDRIPFPLLTRWLGKRRGWMLAGQLGIAMGLIGMATTDPNANLTAVALFALLVAFSSATQDVALDAFRIEAEAAEFQGAMASTYQLGYRLAILMSYAGALYIAAAASWPVAYLTMAALMLVGVVTVLVSPEPDHHVDRDTTTLEARAVAFAERNAHLPRWLRRLGTWFVGAVICPLSEFFHRYGWLTVAILGLVAIFRITDIAMSSMANPLYIDMGYTKTEIAQVSGFFGVFMTMVGAFIGGSTVARFGILGPLLAGATAAAATNLLYAFLATTDGQIHWLWMTIGAENFCGGFAMSVFIAWLSSLTNRAYTATQYALFSSLMTLPGKFLSGFGGVVVDSQGYSFFFTLTALLGVPAILLIAFLLRRGVGGAPVASADDGTATAPNG